jgi:hypothetical protein
VRPEIMTAYHRLLAPDPATMPKAEAVKVCSVCDLFLEWSAKRHKTDTYSWYQFFLQNFCDKYGLLTAVEIKPLHVTRWIDSHEKWKGASATPSSPSSVPLNWAHAEGLIAGNPLTTVKKTRCERFLDGSNAENTMTL